MRAPSVVLAAACGMAATLAVAAQPERVSTRCATRDVAVSATVTDRELVGCGESFSDNVLWNLDRADDILDAFATRTTRGKGAVVYIVDTGVEASHDEFQRDGGTNVIAGLDPVVETSASGSTCGDSAVHPCWFAAVLPILTHGTAVASVVAGKTTGIAPDALLVSVRVIGSVQSSATPEAIWLRAMDDIIHHAFDPATPPFRTAIVNMSASPGFPSATDPSWLKLQEKMKLMIDGVDADGRADPNGKRFLFVSAAGNNDPNPKTSQCTPTGDVRFYPAAAGGMIDGYITVGGTDRQNATWAGSCVGPAVDVYAPAEAILCASISDHNRYRGTAGTTDMSSGTSYAAPYVSGIAARMLEADPTLSPVEIERRIKDTASAGIAVMVDFAGPRRRAARH